MLRKTILIPNKIFKLSPVTNYLYLSKPYQASSIKQEGIFNVFHTAVNSNFLLSLTPNPEIFKKDKIHIDFSDQFLFPALQAFNTLNKLTIDIQDKNINIRKWYDTNSNKFQLGSFELKVSDENHIHLNKYSFSNSFDYVNEIILNNVYKLPKCFYTPDSHTTYIINNKNSTIELNPQVGVNSIIDLSNIETINIVLPLFNIFFEAETFKYGINYLDILQLIIYGPTLIINKKAKIKLDYISSITNWSHSNPAPINFSTSKLASFKNDKNIRISFSNLWLYTAKQELEDNPYYGVSNTLAFKRREVLKYIIKIVEACILNKTYDFFKLKEFKEFDQYISIISKSKSKKDFEFQNQQLLPNNQIESSHF